MKKTILLMLLSVFVARYAAQAQTKVFKEVGEGMLSQVKIIKQDNALVGYLMFTRLEKANVDSFNYRITIMDENLNNIGKVEFKDIGLRLEDVSFDQDVLCLGYLKSNFLGEEFSSRSSYRKALNVAKNFVMLQFISLDGKIIKSNSIKASINVDNRRSQAYGKVYAGGGLKHSISVKNIPQKGFACFYGDDNANNLIVFNPKGQQLWKKKINSSASSFYMLTSGSNIYVLNKTNRSLGTVAVYGGYALVENEGNYEVTGYNCNDTTAETHFTLKDDKGNQLKVLKFDNDAVTGKPYLAGCIIDPKKEGKYASGRDLSKAPYMGVFTINVTGNKPADLKKVFTYWSDGSTPGVSARGLFAETDSYVMLTDAFRDFKGNTYFTGPEMIRRTRWGSIASSIITAPLIVPPIWILGFGGTSKCKTTDAMVVKQDGKGELSVENSVPTDHSSYHKAIAAVAYYNNQSFYTVFNSDTKTNYLVVDDEKNILIYNVNTKTVVRTIPHKDGNIKTYVFPAKEGHIMVSEYNKKERSTRVSIE
ncbi:MAG TPA: DUF6770 family protein, partial [Mucilaginibacter sp.]|nr:DUF6770 family protein [Mucilaginibacter sp.]